MAKAERDMSTAYQTMFKCVSAAAERTPERASVIEIDKDGTENIITWAELVQRTNGMAAYLYDMGVSEKKKVVIALPNSISAVVATLAVWRLGACAFMLSSQLVPRERKSLFEQIQPDLVIAAKKSLEYKSLVMTDTLPCKPNTCDRSFPDYVSKPGKATATGGSTGIPKIIIDESALVYSEDDFKQWGLVTGQLKGQIQLVCGSLHHSLFNTSFYMAMAMGNTNVLMKRFDEDLIISAIGKYHVSSMVLVPTMMSRIIRSPKIKNADLSSLVSLHHAGAACPGWLKKEWIALIGPEKIHEFYSMSERIGMTYIRGDEWLKHEGSVGRAAGSEILIIDDDGNQVPAGTIGNVFFKSNAPALTHYILKSQQLPGADKGLAGANDLGYLDADGYLYLVDRRSDMIVSGGKNVYAAEVENVLKEYHNVRDMVVIGLPDPTWGRRVHAIIEPSCPPEDFSVYDFTNFGFRRMSNYKLPKTIELVASLPRDEAGKIRRSSLAEERANDTNAATDFHYIKVPNGHQLYAWRAKHK